MVCESCEGMGSYMNYDEDGLQRGYINCPDCKGTGEKRMKKCEMCGIAEVSDHVDAVSSERYCLECVEAITAWLHDIVIHETMDNIDTQAEESVYQAQFGLEE